MRILLSCFITSFCALSVAQSPEIGAPIRTTNLRCDAEPACGHFYVNGQKYKVLTSPDAVISIALADTGKYMRADVAITNSSSTNIDVVPASAFVLQSIARDSKLLNYVPPQKMIASANRRMAWANALASAGSSMQTQQSTTQTSSSGNVNVYGSDGSSANGTYNGTSTSTTSSPDYAAQQRTQQQIAQRNAQLVRDSGDLMSDSFLATTLSPGQMKAGRVYFERTKHHEQMLLVVRVGTTSFEFPFEFAK